MVIHSHYEVGRECVSAGQTNNDGNPHQPWLEAIASDDPAAPSALVVITDKELSRLDEQAGASLARDGSLRWSAKGAPRRDASDTGYRPSVELTFRTILHLFES